MSSAKVFTYQVHVDNIVSYMHTFEIIKAARTSKAFSKATHNPRIFKPCAIRCWEGEKPKFYEIGKYFQSCNLLQIPLAALPLVSKITRKIEIHPFAGGLEVFKYVTFENLDYICCGPNISFEKITHVLPQAKKVECPFFTENTYFSSTRLIGLKVEWFPIPSQCKFPNLKIAQAVVTNIPSSVKVLLVDAESAAELNDEKFSNIEILLFSAESDGLQWLKMTCVEHMAACPNLKIVGSPQFKELRERNEMPEIPEGVVEIDAMKYYEMDFSELVDNLQADFPEICG